MDDNTSNVPKVDVSDMFIVSPMGQKINLTPGSTLAGEIVVTNPASASGNFSYRVTLAPYSVSGDEYSVDLATETAYSELLNWITLDPDTASGTLAPNESRHVKFRIDVPADARPGGQYAALLVGSAVGASADSGVLINNIYEIASVLYGKVPGEIQRTGNILENSFPSFVTSIPFTAIARVENQGNIHETAHVTVLVKNALTGEEIYAEKDATNTLDDIIMPGTVKKIPRDIFGLPSVGVFEVTQTIDYMGQYSVETHHVIVCPIWLIVTTVLVLVALFSGIVAIVRQYRKRRSRAL